MDHVVITRFFHALTIQPPSQSPLNLTFAGLLMMAGTPAYTVLLSYTLKMILLLLLLLLLPLLLF